MVVSYKLFTILEWSFMFIINSVNVFYKLLTSVYFWKKLSIHFKFIKLAYEK